MRLLFRGYGILITSIFLSSCATNLVVKKENYSGFLADYSRLTPVTLKTGVDHALTALFNKNVFDSKIIFPGK